MGKPVSSTTTTVPLRDWETSCCSTKSPRTSTHSSSRTSLRRSSQSLQSLLGQTAKRRKCFSSLLLQRCEQILTRYEKILTRCEQILTRYEQILTRCEQILTRCEQILTRCEQIKKYQKEYQGAAQTICTFYVGILILQISSECFESFVIYLDQG